MRLQILNFQFKMKPILLLTILVSGYTMITMIPYFIVNAHFNTTKMLSFFPHMRIIQVFQNIVTNFRGVFQMAINFNCHIAEVIDENPSSCFVIKAVWKKEFMWSNRLGKKNSRFRLDLMACPKKMLMIYRPIL